MIGVRLEILRRERGADKPYRQSVDYEAENGSVTVAKALTDINLIGDIKPVAWECSCMQRKCGACAMVINGRPMLACDARLGDLGARVSIEPLRKFPVVEDLIVDRSVMFKSLAEIGAWMEKEAKPSEKTAQAAYEASRCLQCGCCLEVCPNFWVGGGFFGMAAIVPVSRIIAQLPPSRKNEIYKKYRAHAYSGCGKSLACRSICPAGIDAQSLMTRSNAAAVWRLLFTAYM